MGHDLRQQRGEIGLQHGLRVIGPVTVRHRPGKLQLVRFRIIESDAEGLQRGCPLATEGRHHTARIHPAAEKSPQRNIAPFAQSNGIRQEFIQTLRSTVQGPRRVDGIAQFPEGFRVGFAALVNEYCTRRQRANSVVQRLGPRRVQVLEIGVQGVAIHTAIRQATAHKRGQFRRKCEMAG